MKVVSAAVMNGEGPTSTDSRTAATAGTSPGGTTAKPVRNAGLRILLNVPT